VVHLGQGMAYGAIRSSDWLNEKLYFWFGWKYPSAFRVLGENLALALAWEIGEFVVEGEGDPLKYDAMYSGYALENNITDVVLSMIGCALSVGDGIIWDLKRLNGGVQVKVTWGL